MKGTVALHCSSFASPQCVAYARDKNTSVRVCAKTAGGAYARGGAYLRDTTV